MVRLARCASAPNTESKSWSSANPFALGVTDWRGSAAGRPTAERDALVVRERPLRLPVSVFQERVHRRPDGQHRGMLACLL
jgi:hypothetical protein